ncbi:MAG: DUF1553 domain-containing protein [Armatimonadetes bacterium]|nr:DUF1553 domain-containing protein [Armatimonadota bacterium]
MPHFPRLSVFVVAVACLGAGVLAGVPGKTTVQAKKTIDFNRDVRPILADKCFKCHGSDKNAVMAGLALNDPKSATSVLEDGKRAIVPGKPDESELVKRILSTDEALHMPPAFSNKTLGEADRQVLIQWIKEGAEYKEHWAFVKPVRPVMPPVKDEAWPRNPVDRFILAKLEEKGLRPSVEADRTTLIRRATLDITGLPPTPAEVDAFLNDTSPDAYERLVDRLLASPRYGERMAMDWMDAARYADSNGYQADYERFQWRWRDWVIDAYNKNLPYDEFIVDQLAGDLLPDATLDQKIATAFNRNHRINTEGGVIAEEWRVETVIDRVETTSQAFLALTSGCARCHDHKYDPITQKDFYRLYAYFNNVPESGTGEERPISHPPTIKAPTHEQAARTAEIGRRIQALDADIAARLDANVAAAQDAVLTEKVRPGSLESALHARYELNGRTKVFSHTPDQDHALTVNAPKPVGKPTYGPGRSTGAVRTGKDDYLDCGPVGDFDSSDAFSYGCWAYSDDGRGAPFAKMDTANAYRGWDAMLINGVVLVHLINKFPDNTLKAVTKTPFPNKKWTHLMVTYDGTMKPEGLKVYIDGKPSELTFELNSLSATIKTEVPMTIGRRTGSEIFNGEVDDVQLYDRALTAEEVAFIADVDPAKPLLAVPASKRTPGQKRDLAHYVLLKRDKEYAALVRRRESDVRERDGLAAQVPDLMVMQDMAKPRDAFVLLRGQYDKPGEKVEAGVLTGLAPMPKSAPANRLGLARWIASAENPLTARVAVNRLWERLFGAGIVVTSEDFGTRAEFPTHPELLDWLATEFVRVGWDTKAMMKLLVTSATYRQSSVVTKESLEADPLNRWLGRGPRFRMTAEMIRDQALAASGLLFNKVGGRSVRPYQPDGIWDETSFYGNLHNYRPDIGPNRYRRSLYTIWKRTAAPPDMTVFDAPSRETCRVRRARTNTPLQALTLLNDETYLVASLALAGKSLTTDPRDPIGRAFRLVLGRKATAKERAILVQGYERRLAKFRSEPKAVDALLEQGDVVVPAKLDRVQVAAMMLTCSAILNLDEAVTKE